MKLVIQRVTQARVTVDSKCVGSIDAGALVLVGFTHGDTEHIVQALAQKLLKLRIFRDPDNERNTINIVQSNGGLLLVSQFTLYADTRKGNRPSYTNALPPEPAQSLYNSFVSYIEKHHSGTTQTGQFGAYMNVDLTNDGPVTITLEQEHSPL